MKQLNRRGPRPFTSLLGLVTASIVLLSAARARAGHAEINLRYERAADAESCAGPGELRAAVAGRLGYDPFVSSADLDTVVVRIRRVGSGLEGTIERLNHAGDVRGKPATITSRKSDCAELTAALAVGIAIAIDPLSLTREPPASSGPPPHLEPVPPSSEPSTAPAPEAPRGAAHEKEGLPTKLVVGVGPSIAVGVLPDPSFGVRALAGVSHGMLEVDVEGRFDPPVGEQAPGGQIDASLVLGTLAPCFRYGLAIACAQVSFGALRGTGLGFDHTREDNTFYVAAGARAGLEVPFGRQFAVRVTAEGQVPLRPTRLEAGSLPVWSTPAFGFSATPMLVGRFP